MTSNFSSSSKSLSSSNGGLGLIGLAISFVAVFTVISSSVTKVDEIVTQYNTCNADKNDANIVSFLECLRFFFYII